MRKLVGRTEKFIPGERHADGKLTTVLNAREARWH
jgi:hypothetical protein